MKKRLLKLTALLMSMTMIASVVGGCGTSSSDNSDAESEKEQVVTLLMDRDTPHEGLKAVVAEIEKKFGIRTEIEDIPGGPEGSNLRKTRLATGDMADITFYNTGSLLATLNPEENFVDLSNEAFADTFDEKFKETASVDGKLYGIPAASSQAGAWIYNKKIYEELGLSVPKTWDELISNCEKIKEAGKVAVAGSFTVPGTAQLILLSDFYNVQAQEPDFAEKYSKNEANFSDTPIALRGFEKLEEVGAKGFYNEDCLAASMEDVYKMLAEGTAAHYPALSGSINGIAELYPDAMDDLGMFATPGDSEADNGLTLWMPNAYYVNKNAKNMDAAMKWIEYFCSPEGIKVFEAAEKPVGPYVVKDVKLPEETYDAIKDLEPYVENGNSALALEFVSPVKGPNLPQICVECTTNMSDAKKCAEDYDQDVIKQAKQLGLEGW